LFLRTDFSSFQISSNFETLSMVMSRLHDAIFPAICEKFNVEDRLLTERATEFCKLRITADQLGARIEFSVPLPAAVSKRLSPETVYTRRWRWWVPRWRVILVRSVIFQNISGKKYHFHSFY
jgi:hypothetical protein